MFNVMFKILGQHDFECSILYASLPCNNLFHPFCIYFTFALCTHSLWSPNYNNKTTIPIITTFSIKYISFSINSKLIFSQRVSKICMYIPAVLLLANPCYYMLFSFHAAIFTCPWTETNQSSDFLILLTVNRDMSSCRISPMWWVV